jgi:predicted O-linked N-acetylglucosamine transferase (SPINDLY family)
VAGSVLNAIGLPELITASIEDYQACALRLPRDPDLLGSLKAKLMQNRDTYPLFDINTFTRHVEAAHTAMCDRHRRRQAPASFAVKLIDRAAVQRHERH